MYCYLNVLELTSHGRVTQVSEIGAEVCLSNDDFGPKYLSAKINNQPQTVVYHHIPISKTDIFIF